MSYQDIILKELQTSAEVLNNFLNDKGNIEKIEQAAGIMSDALNNGKKLLSCGNGGSTCDAMHFAEELTGRYRENREPMAAIAIADSSHLTCTANDYGYAYVFSRYVKALGQQGDVLLAISTSGNSENVIKAAEEAKAKGMKVVGLTGKDGGKLATHADVLLNVPYFGFADRIQEMHIKIIHILILLIEKSVK